MKFDIIGLYIGLYMHIAW